MGMAGNSKSRGNVEDSQSGAFLRSRMLDWRMERHWKEIGLVSMALLRSSELQVRLEGKKGLTMGCNTQTLQ